MRITLSGYYGFANLGDEALLQGLLSHLSQHDVNVLSHNPAYTRSLHVTDASPTSTRRVTARHRYRSLITTLLASDVVISGGGSLLQDKTSRRSLQYYLGVIQLAKWLGKTVLVYGQSVGPLSSWGQEHVCTVLQHVPIAVRDENSQQLLADWGLESYLTADSALLLTQTTLSQHKPSKDTLPEKSNAIILIPRAGYPQISQSFIHFAQTYPDYHYHLMPFHPTEDAQEIARLKHAIPKATLRENATPQDALESLSHAKHIYSGRLHGVILAAVAQRPCTGFAYDPKVQAFCAEVGSVCYGLEVAPQHLHQQLADSVNYEAINMLKQRAEKGITWLLEHINRY